MLSPSSRDDSEHRSRNQQLVIRLWRGSTKSRDRHGGDSHRDVGLKMGIKATSVKFVGNMPAVSENGTAAGPEKSLGSLPKPDCQHICPENMPDESVCKVVCDDACRLVATGKDAALVACKSAHARMLFTSVY